MIVKFLCSIVMSDVGHLLAEFHVQIGGTYMRWLLFISCYAQWETREFQVLFQNICIMLYLLEDKQIQCIFILIKCGWTPLLVLGKHKLQFLAMVAVFLLDKFHKDFVTYIHVKLILPPSQFIDRLTFFIPILTTCLIQKIYANIVKFKPFFKNLY